MNKKHTETIDSKLKSSWQAVSRMYNTEATVHGLTIAMGHFLLNIDSHEGAYASDIAPQLGTESTSLSRIISSLEKKKLIVRKADKVDKRKIKIILTQKGIEKKELSKTVVRQFNQLMEIKLGKEKITEFFKIVDCITEIAEERNKNFTEQKNKLNLI